MGSTKNFLDKAGVIYYLVKIKNYISGTYVAKDGNKVLSTNDYTTEEKTKLSGIDNGANKTIVDGALSSSSENPVQNKVVKAAIDLKADAFDIDSAPTENSTNPVSSGGVYAAMQNVEIDVDNTLSSSSENPVQNKVVTTALSGKQDSLTAGTRISMSGTIISADSEIDDSSTTASNTWSASKISNAIAAINSFKVAIRSTLPTENIDEHTIYFIPKTTEGTSNAYNEYMYINNKWELLGDTQVDLSGYVLETDLVAITNAEIDAMFE